MSMWSSRLQGKQAAAGLSIFRNELLELSMTGRDKCDNKGEVEYKFTIDGTKNRAELLKKAARDITILDRLAQHY